MFDLLLRDPRVSTVIKGDRLGAVHEMKPQSLGRQFVSADLTAATDRIDFRLALALWEGAVQAGLLTD